MSIADSTFVLSISYHQYEFVALSFVKQFLTVFTLTELQSDYYWFMCHHLHLILVSVITYALCVQLSDTVSGLSWSVIVILFGPSWYECHHLRCTKPVDVSPLVLVTLPSLTFHPCSEYHQLNLTLGLCLHLYSSPTLLFNLVLSTIT